MLRRLIARFGGDTKTRPGVPEDTLVYAIGDIHGRLDLLLDLEARIAAHAKPHPASHRVLVYIGDYIDRGQDSAGVVEHLVAGPPAGFERVLLRGNHEQFLLDFLDRPANGVSWVSNGGLETLQSYGIQLTEADQGDSLKDTLANVGARFRAALPPAHLAFYRTLRPRHRIGDYLFVHAGIRPGVPIEDQTESDLLWIRYDFLDSRDDHGAVVVHGHTPTDKPEMLPNRIGIDTGAFASGRLTCVALHGTQQEFIQTAGN